MSNIVGANIFTKKLKKPYQSYVKSALENYHRPSFEIISEEEELFMVGNVSPKDNPSIVFKDETNRYFFTLDGTIYNLYDLKNELIGAGVKFQSSNQEEIVAKYLIHFGEEGIVNLDGNFVIVFYDKEKDELLLIRDHLGVKPLLYFLSEESVFFASDLKAFKYLPNQFEIDSTSLNLYFRFTYISAPYTILKGVKKLLPGHYLKVEKGNAEIKKYYSVRDIAPTNLTYEEAQQKTRQLLEDAVVKRLDSTFTRGSFLSGGVDSSIVSKLSNDNLEGLMTFSIGFKDKDNEFFDESQYAKRVAEHINSKHQPIQLGREDVISSLKDIIQIFDEPFADSSVVALYFLTKTAREKVRVCLAGDGADEIFSGYNKHNAYMRSKNPGIILKTAAKSSQFITKGNRRSKIFNKVRQLKKFNTLLGKKWPDSYWFLAEFISEKRREELLAKPTNVKSKIELGNDNLLGMLLLDQEWVLPNDMLKKVDIMSRYNDLEVTSPFLTKEVVEFANSLPDKFKFDGGIGKKILRDTFKNDLPTEVFSRSKKGFEIPLRDWILSSFKQITQKEWFSDEFLSKQGVFSFNGISKLKKDFKEGKEEESTIAMWAYIVFQNWFEQWEKK